MKTIQQVLREIDKEELEKEWFSRYPVQFKDCYVVDNITLKEVLEIEHRNFRLFVEELCNIKVDEESDYILLVTKCVDNELFWYDTILVNKEELLNSNNLSDVESYAYEFNDRNETLAYYVADTELTQNHIVELVISFLYELSFFGYDVEGLEEAQVRLEKSKEEMAHLDESKCLDFDTFMKSIDTQVVDSEDIFEEEYERDVYRAAMNYNNYCRTQELKKLRNLLKRG